MFPLFLVFLSGAACLLWHDDRMVFEIQKSAKWVREAGRPPGLGLGCIGGTVEEGETPMQTMRREALEEIGCPLKISSGARPSKKSAVR